MEHKTFKEKMATMSRKEKVNYVIYYYKYHFIVGILVIAAIASFAVSTLKQKQTVLNASFIGTAIDYSNLNKLSDEATSKLIKEPKKQELTISFSQIDIKNMSGQSSASIQKLMAQLSAHELDVLLIPEDQFNTYCKQGTFMNIDSFTKDSSFKGLHFIEGKSDFSSKQHNYGIDASTFKVINSLNYMPSNNLVIAIPAATKHKSMAISFIKWLAAKSTI